MAVDLGASNIKPTRIELAVGTFRIPVGVGVGSVMAAGFVSLAGFGSTADALVITSGFGFYSATAAVASSASVELAARAFTTNFLWEVLALAVIPLVGRRLSNEAAVGTGGATAMDICLPSLTKTCSTRIAPVAILSGLVLTVAAPLVTQFWIWLLL